jgi:hypothetical protein
MADKQAEKQPMSTTEMMLRRGFVTPEAAAGAIGQNKQNIINLVHEDKLRFVRFGTGPRARIYVEWASVVEHVGEEAAQVLGLSPKRPPALA